MAFIASLTKEIIVSLLAAFLIAVVSRYRKALISLILFGYHYRKYKTDLALLLGRMPFIYKDIDSRVYKDFVEAEISLLNTRTYEPLQTYRAETASLQEKLKGARRIIFLGEAGIGKTTFQRYVTLDILEKGRNSQFFKGEGKLLPIFVPLKVIQNARQSPIFRYILENYAYFTGFWGQRRFARLLRNGQIIFFLDGYDEIAFDDTIVGRNFIKAELNVMMLPDILSMNDFEGEIDPDLKAMYSALSRNRVWLSSRREFYEINPLALTSEKHNWGLSDLLMYSINGVNKNRLLLIQSIFEKYVVNYPRSKEFLNSEFFLRKLNKDVNSEAWKLGNNPLFLTIICYIYANRALEAETYDVPILTESSSLILECVQLLLYDIDEYKVRGQTEIERHVILSRRNLYTDEKKRFLCFFAGRLFIEEIMVFDQGYLCRKAVEFFQELESTPTADDILKELKRSGDSSFFVLQLVYSGVFINAAILEGKRHYDFPHRRFREVLAIEYFSQPENYYWLLVNHQRGHLSEFILLFQESKQFRSKDFHLATFQIILDSCSVENLQKTLVASEAFLQYLPKGNTLKGFSEMLELFLRSSLQEKKTAFWLSGKLLVTFRISKEFLVHEIEKVSARGAISCLAFNALRFLDPKKVEEHLSNQLSKRTRKYSPELIGQILLSNEQHIQLLLHRARGDQSTLYLIGRFWCQLKWINSRLFSDWAAKVDQGDRAIVVLGAYDEEQDSIATPLEILGCNIQRLYFEKLSRITLSNRSNGRLIIWDMSAILHSIEKITNDHSTNGAARIVLTTETKVRRDGQSGLSVKKKLVNVYCVKNAPYANRLIAAALRGHFVGDQVELLSKSKFDRKFTECMNALEGIEFDLVTQEFSANIEGVHNTFIDLLREEIFKRVSVEASILQTMKNTWISISTTKTELPFFRFFH